jgi:5-methylcytosine-specific restriction protein B
MGRLAETLRWVRAADETQRGTREFQERLWEHNHVAAVGQGRISVDQALDEESFRRWLAARSMEPLPDSDAERRRFLTTLYDDLSKKLEPVTTAMPHLKIFRVIAALYPEAMTTIASRGMLAQLARAMGAPGKSLTPVERHVWVRNRLDELLGDPGNDPDALAERIALPWMLYERFVQAPADQTDPEPARLSETRLLPLPAARRRRSLTAIRGLFPGVLSALEFIRHGVTRHELIDFLRASSPDVKVSTLGVTIDQRARKRARHDPTRSRSLPADGNRQ